MSIADIFSQPKPVLGVVHLAPLVGSPKYAGDFEEVLGKAITDAGALVAGGVDGLIVENFGDAPFFPGRVPPEVVSQMTVAAIAVRSEHPDIPLGLNVLRNDGVSALAIALATGAQFIRVNILSGARVTDQGIIQGDAHNLLRERSRLGAHVAICADVSVKHSAPLADQDMDQEVDDLVHRAHADALIVSGSGTGKTTNLMDIRRAKNYAGDVPVWVGSGVSANGAAELREVADGFIVGTAFKKKGLVREPVDEERVQSLVKALRP